RGDNQKVNGVGKESACDSKMIGLHEINQLIKSKITITQCVVAIHQATRRYAKRQLTWFRRQTNFSLLNLSLLTHNEAGILLRMLSERLTFSGVRAKE